MPERAGCVVENENTAMVPIAELGVLTTDQYATYCADAWERVEAGEISVDDLSDLLFGPDPTI